MERDTEIEQIRRELAILRDRYALHRRSAAVLRGFFMVLTPVAAIGALALAIALLMSGAIYGIFVVGVVLLFGVSAIRLVTSSGLRWIDIVSSQLRGIYNPYFFYPDLKPRGRTPSDAELIEQQIADRERRLGELEASAPRA
jgi:hypothetical protein